MKNYFPPKNQNYTYLQTNRSDNLGSLWSTMNLDFQSNLGALRVSPRLLINTSTADQANLGCPCGFKYFDDRYYTIAGTRIFRTSTSYNPASPFVEDSSTGVQTDYNQDDNDLEVFDNKLWAIGNGDLYYSDGATWTLMSTTPTVYGNLIYGRKFNRLYLTTSNNEVHSTDGVTYASTGDYTISLAESGDEISSVCETMDSIWIGMSQTSNNENSEASIYRWDGISPQASERFYLKAPGAYALVTMDNIPYVMDSFGVLSKFTGSSFEEVARLPFSNILMYDNSAGTDDENSRFIHPKGMIVTKNATILMLVSNTQNNSNYSTPENCPSGIYEYSPDIGITHKYSLSYSRVDDISITDYGQNQISNSSSPIQVGGLAQAWTPDPSSARNGMLMIGAAYFTNATTQKYAIFIDDSNNNRIKKGYFVTTWFNTDEVENKWSRLWAVYKRFLSSNDFIVFKYRLYEENPTIATITWTSETTFTTTTNVSSYGPTATGFNGTIGGEVEVIQGTGSGACAHITNVVNDAGTYTVTLDSTVNGVTGTAKVRLQKWIKLLPEITGQIKSWENIAIGQNNTRIQIKCCLTFIDDGENWNEFTKLILTSNNDIEATL